jgi:hypothetical protein
MCNFLKYAEYMSDFCKNDKAFIDVYFCLVDKQTNMENRMKNSLDGLSIEDKTKALTYLIKAYDVKNFNAILQVQEYLLTNKYINKVGDSILIINGNQ